MGKNQKANIDNETDQAATPLSLVEVSKWRAWRAENQAEILDALAKRKELSKRKNENLKTDVAETIKQEEATQPSTGVSPYGLGPYPEIPKEWNFISNYWESMCDSIEDELLTRVCIKMHNEGIRSKYGSVGINPSTLMIIALERGSVLIKTEIDENGEERMYGATAHPDDLSGIYTHQSEIPLHLKIVTAEEIEFDPYEYLGLQKP